MTPRTRWTLTLLAIVILFGANCGLYLWANARRSAALLEFKSALESKDLLLEIRIALEDRQREIEILGPLLRSGAASPGADHLSSFKAKVLPLDALVGTLAADPGDNGSDAFTVGYRQLKAAWLAAFEGTTTSPTPKSPPVVDVEAGFADTHRKLESLFMRAVERVTAAEARFAVVARRTDRMMWSIFTLSLILVTGMAFATARHLRTTLDRYVSPQVASSLLEGPGRQKMGGQRVVITVLMADLRGFSGLAERLPPETVVTMINNFLEVMTDVILMYGGTIDEFIGDAILVIFGAPAPLEDHPRLGVACAIRMQLAMDEVHRRNRELGLPEVEMGIGIHTGEAVVGNVGSERRAKFGAVGRHVNLAARIQSTAVGGQIMVSERTALKAGWDLTIRDGVKISPKGFSKPVGLLDIRGIGGEHDLHLLDADPEMTTLAAPLAAEISLMSDAGPVATWPCEVAALSPQRAELRSDRPVALLSSVVLVLAMPADNSPAPKIYAKVVNTGGADGHSLVVRFTSVPPEAGEELRRLLPESAT